jgi:hypothetical protein
MKKVLVLILGSLVAVVLTACGGGQANTADNTAAQEPAAGASTQSFVDSLKSGSYSFDYSATVSLEGNSVSSTGIIAKKGEIGAFKSNTVIAGKTVELRIIINKKTMTTVDDAAKTATEQKFEAPEGTGPDAFATSDFSKLVSIGTGEEEVNGKLLQYDEYELPATALKFYSENGQIVAIKTSSENPETGLERSLIMEISNITSTPDSALFEVPSDYKVKKAK